MQSKAPPNLPHQGELNVTEATPWGSRTVDCYETVELIGEGTYGQVFLAKDLKTGKQVALKKVRMDNEKEGFPITAIREIKILKKLDHPNVIKLNEIVTSKSQDPAKSRSSVYMVFEYMDHDLTGLAERPGMRFTTPQIKCYLKQLLEGLNYCHVNNVLHRDIKGSNLLIDNNGILKLADFGLARSYTSESAENLTNRVITLWYRPPELLMGATKYGPSVDMWSVGCIFAELLCGRPLLPGKNEVEQLNLIFELCGSPDESNWPGVSKLPHFQQFRPEHPLKRKLRETHKNFDKHELDLIDKMLTLDPAKRISAKDALNMEYFWTEPLPCDPASLPKYDASHEYQTKKKKQQLKEEAAKKQRPNPPNQRPNRLPPPPGGFPPTSRSTGGGGYASNAPHHSGPGGGYKAPGYGQHRGPTNSHGGHSSGAPSGSRHGGSGAGYRGGGSSSQGSLLSQGTGRAYNSREPQVSTQYVDIDAAYSRPHLNAGLQQNGSFGQSPPHRQDYKR